MYLLSENNQGTTLEELLALVNQRALQIICLCAISMVLCQVLKCVILSFRERRMVWHALYTTGGFPSSHTCTCVTLVVSLFLFQLHDLNGKIDWSFAVAVIFSVIVIHDAMGVRLEASKHAQILNHLTEDMTEEQKKNIGFGRKLKLKEMLGHKGFEVVGGLFLGFAIGVAGYFILVGTL